MDQANTQTAATASLEDILTCSDVVDAAIRTELAGVFAQRRSAEAAFTYARTLSPKVKANAWALAEAAGHESWYRFQALLSRYAWDWTDLRSRLAPLAARFLACADDDLIGPGIAVDETAHLKKGEDTFAVSPQHVGCTGKVENCVTSVFSAYVTTAGSCWADFDIYMARRWDEDPVRRAKARVPAELGLVTKPDLAAGQLRRLTASGIPVNWVAGDEVYGRSSFLRAVCEELGLAYVFAVPADYLITTPAGSIWTAEQAAVHGLFERRSCGKGSKGPRYFDWAMTATDSPRHFLLISRPDQMAFFICYVPDPAKATVTCLITIAGRRWPVEETFKTGKRLRLGSMPGPHLRRPQPAHRTRRARPAPQHLRGGLPPRAPAGGRHQPGPARANIRPRA